MVMLPEPFITNQQAEPLLCSGWGSYHSNGQTVKNPRPYEQITLSRIRQLVDNPQNVDKKQAQWIIPSTLLSRASKDQESNGEYWLLWADIDDNQKQINPVDIISNFIGHCNYEIYATKTATENNPKFRILVPLNKSLCYVDWNIYQSILNDYLDSCGLVADRASEKAAQLCYLPNRGEFYHTTYERSGNYFDPSTQTQWLGLIQSKRQSIREQAQRLEDQRKAAESPLKSSNSDDLISAFNQAFSVESILIKADYAQRGDTFRHPKSQSGSFSASVEDGKVHSLSSDDPLYTGGGGVGSHDAFSAFTVLFHAGDRNAALKDAGDNLKIDNESWNTVKRREYAQSQAEPPEPLPEIPSVDPFNYDHLPPIVRDYIKDIADRMQCPPDYLGVTVYAMLAAVIGRKVGIRPMKFDDWTVIPNLWAASVGNSGTLKSPAQANTLAPIKKLEVDSFDRYKTECEEYEQQAQIQDIRVSVNKTAAKKRLNNDPNADVKDLVQTGSVDDAPMLKRYITNDSTYEALGDLLIQNPNGLLVESDELIGLLKRLDTVGQEPARAFYLTAADGDKSYTFDRIGRGKALHVPALCISIIGGIQPGVLSQYVRDAVGGGAGADGLLQRFGLLVYPDISKEWREVDRYPDINAKESMHKLIYGLNNFNACESGARSDNYSKVPHFQFDAQAQVIFSEWRARLETRLRSGEEHEAFVSHLSKYRKLVPALALINHLCTKGWGDIDKEPLLRAIAYSEYLESHARRVYSFAVRPDIDAAKTLLNKLPNAKLKKTFTAREIYLKGWTGLNTPKKAQAAIDVLIEYRHLIETEITTGGRPTKLYCLNDVGHKIKK